MLHLRRFVLPGEIALVLGGVLAFQHRVALPAVLVAGVAGAVLGDSVGYAVGRRWGRRLLEGTLGRIIRHEHLDRAVAYLRERGGKAVLLGRFTTALRVPIPSLAGMSRMHYPTFAAYNVAGGVIWAAGFVLVGYAAGSSWRHVESVAKGASLLVLGLVETAAIVALAVRWAARHQASCVSAQRDVGVVPTVWLSLAGWWRALVRLRAPIVRGAERGRTQGGSNDRDNGSTGDEGRRDPRRDRRLRHHGSRH